MLAVINQTILNILDSGRTSTVFIIVIFYLILNSVYNYYPLLAFEFQGSSLSDSTINMPIEDYVSEYINETTSTRHINVVIPEKNTLVIPKIGVRTNIIEGADLRVLNTAEGVWHEPQTANPLKPGNMVIAGHRRQFLPPNTSTFYLLPELKVGDVIIVYWEKQEYLYKITHTRETFKDDPFAYEKTKSDVLTLYTCIPLETADSRFLIRAEKITKK